MEVEEIKKPKKKEHDNLCSNCRAPANGIVVMDMARKSYMRSETKFATSTLTAIPKETVDTET